MYGFNLRECPPDNRGLDWYSLYRSPRNQGQYATNGRGSRQPQFNTNLKTPVNQKNLRQHDELTNSAWNSRGWTFQEQIFSRKLLIYGEKEISWECYCTVAFELLEGLYPPKCSNNTAIVAQGSSIGIEPRIRSNASHVEQYNHRDFHTPRTSWMHLAVYSA